MEATESFVVDQAEPDESVESESESNEMLAFKERLLNTDDQTSRKPNGPRYAAVEHMINNLETLDHMKCLLCGYEFEKRKILYKHYRNKFTCIKQAKPLPQTKGS